jgi:hypothetical protein
LCHVGEPQVVVAGVVTERGERLGHVRCSLLGQHALGLFDRGSAGQRGLQVLVDRALLGRGLGLDERDTRDVSQCLSQSQVIGVERPDCRAEQAERAEGGTAQPHRQGVDADESGHPGPGDELRPALCFFAEIGS